MLPQKTQEIPGFFACLGVQKAQGFSVDAKRCKDSGSVGALSSCLYSSTIFSSKRFLRQAFLLY
jgi:hypothetical protein